MWGLVIGFCIVLKHRHNNFIYCTAAFRTGYADIGYANPAFKTPTIDNLASSGVKLDRLYVQSTCSPTRAALLTGRHSWDVGLGDGAILIGESRGLSADAPTLAEVLKNEGYRTVGIGKWHLGGATTAQLPTSRGFDEFFGLMQGANDFFDYDVGLGCNAANPVTPDPFPPSWGNNCFFNNAYDMLDNEAPATDLIGTKQYATELFGMKAVSKIAAHDPSVPLFLYLAPTAPHSPLQAPPQYIQRCGPVPNPAGALVPGGATLHCAMMAALDDMVKNVTDALTSKGMMDDTIIVYLSDNGGIRIFGSDMGGFRGSKGSFFEGGVRSNGFISGPGADVSHPGRSISELVDVTDLYATIADYAGIDKSVAEAGAGKSIRKSIEKANRKVKRDNIPLGKLGTLYGLDGSATVFKYANKFWKLTNAPNVQSVLLGYEFSFALGFHLFDLTTDPGEQNNLYGVADALPPLENYSSSSSSEESSSSSEESSSEEDNHHPNSVLRGALEHGRALLAELDSVESIIDTAGGFFINAHAPTQRGCWLPTDSPFAASSDCGIFPVIPPPFIRVPPIMLPGAGGAGGAGGAAPASVARTTVQAHADELSVFSLEHVKHFYEKAAGQSVSKA